MMGEGFALEAKTMVEEFALAIKAGMVGEGWLLAMEAWTIGEEFP